MNIVLTKDGENRGGLANFISWTRLIEQLRRAGEFRADEIAIRLEVDERGITYFVKTT